MRAIGPDSYIEYHNLTGSSQALIQAMVSSYSGYIGQLALYSNAVARTYLGSQYPGTTDNFSQIIASDLLDKIKANVADGGTGVFTDDKILEFAKLQWEIRGIGDCFPGNVLVGKFTACTFAVNLIGAAVSAAGQGTGLFTPVITGGSLSSPDVPAGGQRVTSPDGQVTFIKDASGNVVLGSVVRTSGAPEPFTFSNTMQNNQVQITSSSETPNGTTTTTTTLDTSEVNGARVVTGQTTTILTEAGIVQYVAGPSGQSTSHSRQYVAFF